MNGGPTIVEELVAVRAPWRHWLVRIALVGALALIFVRYGLAQIPPLMNQAECTVLGEMVMSARALNKHGVSGEQLDKIMTDFYRPMLERPAGWRVELYLKAIGRFVSRQRAQAFEPHDLAEQFANECRSNGGRVGAIFGVDS